MFNIISNIEGVLCNASFSVFFLGHLEHLNINDP